MIVKQNLTHVLHIASGDLWAGAEVQLFTLARALRCKLQVPVSVILLNHGELENKLQAAGINVIVLDESKLNRFQILYNLIQLIRTLQPNVIHTHRLKENILGSIVAMIYRLPSLRTVHGAPEHRPAWWQLPKRLIRSLDWFCGRFLQLRIIAVSDDLARILAQDFPKEKITVIENGIDIEEIRRHKVEVSDVNINPNKPIKVGLVGRLVPVKRVDLFIQIARYIRDHYPDLKISFHIIGNGPIRDELEKLNGKLKVENIVHFEGHTDDIYNKLQQLDLLLITSDHEGLPMVLLEAMALEIPIIAHAVGGIPLLLELGKCGVLVDSHAVAEYASEILRFAKFPEKFMVMAKKAFDRIKKRYSADKNAVEYLSIYSGCIKQAV